MRLFGGGDKGRMIGQAQIVIGAEIQYVTATRYGNA